MAAVRSPVSWRPQHALARQVGAPRPISTQADIGATVGRFDRPRLLLHHATAHGLDGPVAVWSRASFDERVMSRDNHLMDGHASSAQGTTGRRSCRHGPRQDRSCFGHTVEALAICSSEASAVTAWSGSNRATWSSLCLVSLLLHPSKGSDPTSTQRCLGWSRSFPSVTVLQGRLLRQEGYPN